MAGHALRIERAAISDGARIRREALSTASSVVAGHYPGGWCRPNGEP